MSLLHRVRKFLKIYPNRPALLIAYQKAMRWVLEHSRVGEGIWVHHRNRTSYPEVTGYFIPSLLDWGQRDRAQDFGQWLIDIQQPNGSWLDPSGETGYSFDTGQVLKGLLSLADDLPEAREAALKGCDFLCAQSLPTGQLLTPSKNQWHLPRGKMIPEAIHLYTASPLLEAAERFGKPEYREVAHKMLRYYTNDLQALEFRTLSHFHAYIVEALIDVGELDLARKALQSAAKFQRSNGAIAAYPDVSWICSTGIMQYAVCGYKLGEFEFAERAFDFSLKLQNSSGGFYGSRGLGADYFPREEISWAAKYFLDALTWKIKRTFEIQAPQFPDEIHSADGRLALVLKTVKRFQPMTILDAGCAKGRYLKRLQDTFPDKKLFGMDLSSDIVKKISGFAHPLTGSNLRIPSSNENFDFIYCIESLEHSLDTLASIREFHRVLKPGGALLIIDKNRASLGSMQIESWEQWFSESELASMLNAVGFDVEIQRNLAYDDFDGSDNLFLAWVCKKL